ncbi:MAG: hypothetical protein MJ025_00335 [Victivallaceae bacterium]|nr:hypothetical protein [Victivallaceae bacterium]
MANLYYKRLFVVAGAAVLLFFAGCYSIDSKKEQEKLATLYYGGNIAEAAQLATQASNGLAGSSDAEALLWHLEAGSTNLDAGNMDAAIAALNRAEKYIYCVDDEDVIYQHPGVYSYRGTRNDRLMLHLLKGFYYLAQNSFEDFLVEIRRLRRAQFRYVHGESDPAIDEYERSKKGGANGLPLRMQQLTGDRNLNAILSASGTRGKKGALDEYCRTRRHTELPLMYNPLAFYLSAIGYFYDREYQDAKIDLEYLLRIDPDNRIYKSDMAAVCRALMEPPPPSAAGEDPTPGGNVVCVIWASGRPSGWKSRTVRFKLNGYVPSEWTYSYPDKEKLQSSKFSAKWKDGKKMTSGHLADVSEIAGEEYWQLYFSQMVKYAYEVTESTTAANNTAKASLAAAMTIPDKTARAAAIVSAQAAVAATSKASIKQEEWRRWITLPRSYEILNIALPPPSAERKLTIVPPSSAGIKENLEISFAPKTKSAIVYIREIGSGKCIIKNWESKE